MRRSRLVLLFATIIALYGSPRADAQAWSGIIAPSRAVDWSTAGADPTLRANRTAICVTEPTTVTLATLNSDISACSSKHPSDAGGIVVLPAGSFTFTGHINMASNVTLQGQGANQTKITVNDTGVCATVGPCAINIFGPNVSFPAGSVTERNENAHVSWTGTNGSSGVYTKGATTLNLSSVAGTHPLHVGDLLFVYQTDVTTPQSSGPFVCQAANATNGCSTEGADGVVSGNSFGMQQAFKVVSCGTSTAGAACTSTAVVVDTGVYADWWGTGGSGPSAYWWGNDLYGIGIENLYLSTGTTSGWSVIAVYDSNNCWVKGVVTQETGDRDHIILNYTRHFSILDSWAQDSCTGGCGGGATGYGYEFGAGGTHDSLVQNNILNNVQASLVLNNVGVGNVIAYNYDNACGNGNCTSFTIHGEGEQYELFEGNNTNLFRYDSYHGNGNFITLFRNRISTNADQAPVDFRSYVRYTNLIGNVLGTSSGANATTTYTCATPNSASVCNRFSGGNTAAYRYGYGFDGTSTNQCEGSNCINNDTQVATTTMRWGNYDTMNAAVRFVSSEVPSGIPDHANPVPSNQLLPASFYLSSKPAWWPVLKAWPAVGPDVIGGNVTGVGGFANTIPAQDCYNSISGLLASFSAATCYATAVGSGPAPPTGLTAVVQ